MKAATLFQGIIPPLATPLADDDRLDEAGLEKLVEHELAGGVSGLFLLGTTGEGLALSCRLRSELVERVCRQVAGRVSVLVGITDTSPVEQVKFAEDCARAGATAVVMAAPHYFPLDQEELSRYVELVARQLPLPLMLYNMPSHTKTAFSVATVARAMQHEKIVGIKDSSGDIAYFQELLELKRARADWSVLMGPEEMLAEATRRGGDGGVSGGANVFPRLYVGLYEAVRDGREEEAKRLRGIVARFAATAYSASSSPNRVILGVKAALKLLGVCSDRPAAPLVALVGKELEQVRRAVEEVEGEMK